MTNAIIFLLDTFSRLYLFILLLRFWLPFLRANFRNPVAQGVMRYTSPLVNPGRRFGPSGGRVDTATILIAFLSQVGAAYLIMSPPETGAFLRPGWTDRDKPSRNGATGATEGGCG